jgi:GGDEF domain-containing protein
LERHAADGLPFAVLLVEVLGVAWLAQAEHAAALAGLLDRVEEAIRPELRSSESIVRESPGRWWLIASRTDSRGARTLAERLARTVRAAVSHRGEPLQVAFGIAVCPEDGGDATVLAAHAEVGLYAARAAGWPVAPVDDPAQD